MRADRLVFNITPAKADSEPFTLWIGSGLTMVLTSFALAALLCS